MARKSSFKRLHKNVASRKRRARKNPSESKEKSWISDLGLDEAYQLVLPGVVGYTGTRLAGRIGYQIAKRKSVGWAKHIGPWTSVVVSLATWWATKKFTKLQPYREGAVIGSSIAAIQGVLQAYLPQQWSWILNDYHLDDVLPQQLAPGLSAPAVAPKYSVPGTRPASPPSSDGDVDIDGDDFSDIPGMGGSLKSGIFA